MANKSRLRVHDPPPKPLLIWDGECVFCRRWIERWRDLTADEVDYAPYQDVADRFPEISRDQFEESVVLVESSGEVFFAAEAVYRCLRFCSSRKWMAWCYDNVPGFARISETGYRFISRHRNFASKTTQLLWGKEARAPTYHWAQKWFLRMLGLIYLIAFISLWVQVDGLVGAQGIWPIKEILSAAADQYGSQAYWLLPTLCWLNSTNAFLHFLCGAGVVLSLLLIVEIAPALSLLFLFVCYLSLTIAGQTFLSFQWDILLLETGFLAMFFAPWRLTWRASRSAAPPSRLALFLLKLLLFKLMVMSGVVKLSSGDISWGWFDSSWHWSMATALDYHYWSQPLPTVFAWWADQSPEWFKHFSVVLCLVIEIVIPFLIWAPRRPRIFAAILLVFLQICIAITGNYCFFNLLTIALCLVLIDDATLGRTSFMAAWTRRPRRVSTETRKRRGRRFYLAPPGFSTTLLPRYAASAVLIVTLPVNLWLLITAFKPAAHWPRPLEIVYGRLESFHLLNGYGLFRVMTKDRIEIQIEGSPDGIVWKEYEFKWKPGDVTRPPLWCAPHQPRLDWQMWFAALGGPQDNPWFVRTLICLLEGQPAVENLFARNPFPDRPPRYVRAMSYRYRFTTRAERRETGAWWTRRELREYVPAVSLEQLK